MFSSTAILSVFVSLLLASQSVAAVPSPRSPSPFLSMRQSSSESDSGLTSFDPQCVGPCTKMNNTLSSITTVTEVCTNAVVSQVEACYDCELNVLAATLEFLQNDIDTLVQACADLGRPVKSVTIIAKSGGERLSLGISGSVVVGMAALFLVVL
ncbi:hypothetical protein C8J57DRAFT_1308777 [Mycena rebaudengoi]|nr:hypothetical protein C8J57DRAFT_1308777 [Mycena rebaudengoi]